MGRFTIFVNNFQPLTIVAKPSILIFQGVLGKSLSIVLNTMMNVFKVNNIDTMTTSSGILLVYLLLTTSSTLLMTLDKHPAGKKHTHQKLKFSDFSRDIEI